MIQTSCSELLVDTQIHDPVLAFNKISQLMKEVGWESSPPLTVELLKELKDYKDPEITVYDKHGNQAWLEYGSNGYIESLGFRFDSHCNHCDDNCFPIFDAAIEKLQGQLIACDGGSKDYFNEWKENIGVIEGEFRSLDTLLEEGNLSNEDGSN